MDAFGLPSSTVSTYTAPPEWAEQIGPRVRGHPRAQDWRPAPPPAPQLELPVLPKSHHYQALPGYSDYHPAPYAPVAPALYSPPRPAHLTASFPQLPPATRLTRQTGSLWSGLARAAANLERGHYRQQTLASIDGSNRLKL